MSRCFWRLWRQLDRWRRRRRARGQELGQRQRQRQRAVWGGPVEADRVLAFSDAGFAIAITLNLVDDTVLVRNLLFLGLIVILPFPVRLLGDYPRRPVLGRLDGRFVLLV